MTTDVRETLHDIGASVVPPDLDPAAFDGRVRRARTRRRFGQAAVATAALAAVGVAAWLVAPGGGGGAEPDLVSDLPTTDVPPTSRKVIAFEEQGRLFVSTPEDASVDVDTGVELQEIVALLPGRVVYVDPESQLMEVDLHDDGTVGVPGFLVPGGPVQWAGVDSDGATLWWVTLDDQLGTAGLEQADDAAIGYTDISADSTVLDVGTNRWVEDAGDGSVRLHTGTTSYDVNGSSMSAELVDDVLAVMTQDGTEIWSATDGTRRVGARGAGTAALSPDGRWVASGADDGDLDAGMSKGLWLEDTGTGKLHEVAFADVTGPVVDIWWDDSERYFAVVETSADGQPVHTLYECTITGTCQLRIEDETGTMWLPRD